MKFLYGGSVNSQNAGGFLSQPNIDGALVGGASLNSEEFSLIVGSYNS
ncbi:MAG: triose-phosphate isomerase [Patescibacteria group bacterium]